MQQAVLTEPLSCIAHGWTKINPIHVGEKVLVLGAGIIGLLWTSMLHLHGLRKTVTVSEPQEKRRLAVQRLGKDLRESNFSRLMRTRIIELVNRNVEITIVLGDRNFDVIS